MALIQHHWDQKDERFMKMMEKEYSHRPVELQMILECNSDEMSPSTANVSDVPVMRHGDASATEDVLCELRFRAKDMLGG
ncbi:hypothetical protein BM221_001673 [Beauveria bassiana]|uniref:Uncharacterized protein n=1 Tax=Beauveria bassiana TaxID=176275 RepID=A0A2N6NWD7_BEABA|nr:hypothetical protein BM221_001673 [Beauveria bassiana]